MSVQNFLLLFLCYFGRVKGETADGSKEDFIKWNNFVTSVNQKLYQLESALIEKDDKINFLEVKVDVQTAEFTRRFETQEIKISKQNEELSCLKRKVASLLHQEESVRLGERYTGQTHTKLYSLEHRPWSETSSQSTKKLINSITKNDLLLPLNTDGNGKVKESQVFVGFHNLTYSPRKRADIKSISSSAARHPTEGNPPATLFHRSITANQSSNRFSQGEFKDASKTSRRVLQKFPSEIQDKPSKGFVHNSGNNMEYKYPSGHTLGAAYFPKTTESNYEVEKPEQRLKQKRVSPYTNRVAFHTTTSATKTTGTGSTIVYDQEMLDIGDGYDPTDGVYTVPESGVYVITWTTLSQYHDHLQTLLVVSGATKGISWSSSQSSADIHQTTALVVLMLNQGDHVFVRVDKTINQQTFSSSLYGQPTFSGWKLN